MEKMALLLESRVEIRYRRSVKFNVNDRTSLTLLQLDSRTLVRSGLLSETKNSVFGQESTSDNSPFGGLLSEFVFQFTITMSNGFRFSDNSPFGGLLSEHKLHECLLRHVTHI